jgi:hypothetical protein
MAASGATVISAVISTVLRRMIGIIARTVDDRFFDCIVVLSSLLFMALD